MSEWATVRLTPESWDATRWLSDPAVGPFPQDYAGPTVRLGDVASAVPVRDRPSSRQMVVTPGGVDRTSGSVVRTKSGANAPACSLDGDLQEGDVLVPRYGTGPCVFVRGAHAKLAFANFVPVRVSADRINASVLWAILTSTSGIRARESHMRGVAQRHLRSADLLEALVPLFPATDVLRTRVGLLLPSPEVDLVAPPVRESDWACVDLKPNDWWRPVATVGMPVETGPTLGEVGDLISGRAPRTDPVELEFPGSLPLADSKWVRTGDVRQWHPADQVVEVATGAVVLTMEGIFRARVTAATMGLGRGVIALKPRSESPSSDALAAYLNGDAGQVVLAQLAVGTAIARVNAKALAGLRLPTASRLEALAQSPSPDVQPLAELLEDALWGS